MINNIENRRDFLKKALLLTGGLTAMDSLLDPILKAASIPPNQNSSFLDAEHVVILMQENRSFDHMYGTLQGVRGFNDPRAIKLPNGNPVWLQSDSKGNTYSPFHLDLINSKSTWMRDLPHSWPDQTDARNNGFYNKWLEAKGSNVDEYKNMPLTMGYYDRRDLPFYYSLADAFTVCDHYFCSALSSTTPNRIHLWSGTLRDPKDPNFLANVWNSDAKPWNLVHWKSFPERMEDHNISWKVYQNELYKKGLPPEKEPLLDNFGDNTLENFAQYRVDCYQNEKFEGLSEREKSLHRKAFTTNVGDKHYHEIEKYSYTDGEEQHEVELPKGDLLHQFRQDVKNKELPTVSWLVPPGRFSDHPGHPWYGAWYVSEIFKILTDDPEVWKKTIFILNYDENDGYFDHIPPFVPPHPNAPESGKVSSGINSRTEYVLSAEEQTSDAKDVRVGPIGLGYRVPMIVASPWSRGGWVNSEVADHTSTLMFLEKFLSHKVGQAIEETNISAWRRTVCGDLTSVFRKADESVPEDFQYLDRNSYVEQIHKARFKKVPDGFKSWSKSAIEEQQHKESSNEIGRIQEPGTRPACAIPYFFDVNGKVKRDGTFQLIFANTQEAFGKKAVGVPLTVYTLGSYRGTLAPPRQYAIASGDVLTDDWAIDQFDDGNYHLNVHGPNGFYREFVGGKGSEKVKVEVKASYLDSTSLPNPCLTLHVKPLQAGLKQKLTLLHHGYARTKRNEELVVEDQELVLDIDLSQSHGWYDFSVLADGDVDIAYRYAGHIETGKASFSDSLMGQVDVQVK